MPGMNTSIHCGAVQYRLVSGSGILNTTVENQDGSQEVLLASINMNNVSGGVNPYRAANLISQKIKVRVETNNLNEVFEINEIVIWAKPTWQGLGSV